MWTLIRQALEITRDGVESARKDQPRRSSMGILPLILLSVRYYSDHGAVRLRRRRTAVRARTCFQARIVLIAHTSCCDHGWIRHRSISVAHEINKPTTRQLRSTKSRPGLVFDPLSQDCVLGPMHIGHVKTPDTASPLYI